MVNCSNMYIIYICRHICTDRLYGRRHHKPYGFRRNPISSCCNV